MAALLLRGCWNTPYGNVDDEMHVRIALEGSRESWLKQQPYTTYFPVTLLSYKLDHALFGNIAPVPVRGAPRPEDAAGNVTKSSAVAMRLMNGLYHLLAGFMLWKLLLRLGAGAGLSAFVALAWTGHPLACESVCWIAERKNVLAAFFGFAALLAWTVERRRMWRWPLVCILFALAVLSKPSALGFLPVLAALEMLDPVQRAFSPRNARHWVLLLERLAVPALISIAAISANIRAHGMEIVDPPGGSVWTALLTDVEIFARYAGNILFPSNLSFYYGVEPIVSPADGRLWFYGLLLFGFFGAVLRAAGRERRRLAALGVLWFFGALGPSSNIVAIPFWMQDRFVYLSTPGLLLALGLAAINVARTVEAARQADNERGAAGGQPLQTLPWLAGASLALLAVMTFARSALWANSDFLELEAAQRQPRSAMAHIRAGHIWKTGLQRHGPRGERPNAQLAATCATQAAIHYRAAQDCPAVDNFNDAFTLRMWESEMIWSLDGYVQALDVLGPIPPPDMEMLPDEDPQGKTALHNRRTMRRGYPPRTLASAWLISAECKLTQSFRLPDKSPEQRSELARQAAAESEKSLAVARLHDEALLTKGRALIRIGDLYAQQRDMAQAMKFFNDGIAALRSVAPSSRSAKTAKVMLENFTPPKEPPPEPPKEAKASPLQP